MTAETAEASSSMLDQALTYLGQGLSIFPVCTPVPGTPRCLHHQSCAHPGKVPLVKWGAYQDDRATEDTVRTWWRRWPEANIGMATGRASGACVIDLDGDLATRQAVDRGFDIGPWAYTGRVGGRHVWFAHREDAPTIFAKVGGIDFRGQGGYVLLPPSLHHTGTRYRWAEPPNGTPLPDLPRWVDDLAAHPSTTSHHTSGSQIDVEYLLEFGVAEGQRDDTLFRLAAKLRGLGVPYDLAIDLVERSAERCIPPFPLDQARAKVESAYRRYEPNPEPSKPIRLKNGATVDPTTGEVLDEWQFIVRSASEFAGLELPPIEWIGKGLIREQGIVGNFGGPGTLKTYFATQFGICVSLGQDFLEIPTKRTRVLIVQEDTAESDFQQVYFNPMLKAMGLKSEQLDGWLFIATANDLLIDDASRVAALDAWMAEHQPGLLVLDAFFLLHHGEGMTAKDLGPILQTLKRLRKKHRCAIWLIDHNRKTSKSGNEDDPIDHWYGGRPKSAAADGAIESRAVHGQDDAAEYRVVKMRGGQKLLAPFQVRIKDGCLHLFTSSEALAAACKKVYDWLIAEEIPKTLAQIQAGTGLSERATKDSRAQLAQRGWIEEGPGQGRAKTWVAVPMTGTAEED